MYGERHEEENNYNTHMCKHTHIHTRVQTHTHTNMHQQFISSAGQEDFALCTTFIVPQYTDNSQKVYIILKILYMYMNAKMLLTINIQFQESTAHFAKCF